MPKTKIKLTLLHYHDNPIMNYYDYLHTFSQQRYYNILIFKDDITSVAEPEPETEPQGAASFW
jgi:hypothetical protein